jgi:hypothetical protein
MSFYRFGAKKKSLERQLAEIQPRQEELQEHLERDRANKGATNI